MLTPLLRFAATGAFAAFTTAAVGQQSVPARLDFSRAWFRPASTFGDAAICADFAVAIDNRFSSGEPLGYWPDATFGNVSVVNEYELPTDDGDNPRNRFVLIDGEKVYLRRRTLPGTCGGWCERQELLVSLLPFPTADREVEALRPDLAPVPPSGESNSLLVGTDGRHFYLALREGAMELFALGADASWTRTCEVAIAPPDLDAIDDDALAATLASIERLLEAASTIAGDSGGDCYLTQTSTRWNDARRSALREAVYRPALPRPRRSPSENSYGDYERIRRNLDDWSLTGFAEHRMLLAYETQLASASEQLAQFYTTHFGWTLDTARAVAKLVVEHGIASGMGFYQYEPLASDAERQLRRAILEGAPLDTIRAIDLEAAAIDGDDRRETVLSTAILRADVVGYLLENGANPDRVNAFGKTPLMYAAQNDSVESARLLLEHGADPNAATTWPNDRCTYPLQRARVTALHYAVRYASPELVELLLDAGAVTYAKTEEIETGRVPENPLDWLQRYSATGSDRNPSIPDGAVARLAGRLEPPTEDETAAIGTQLILRAEAQYAAGDAAASYRTLKNALRARPEDTRALSDLSLVALRVGMLGESLAASRRLIDLQADARLTANAWFNQGLACEQVERFFAYDGDYYCRASLFVPFLAAWSAEPTSARARKIEQLFEETFKVCVVDQPDGTKRRYYFTTEESERLTPYRMYVYHAAGTTIDPASITWAARGGDPALGPQTIAVSLQPSASHDLGSFAVTVLATRYPLQSPYTVDGTRCL
jgi:hypothetical protein